MRAWADFKFRLTHPGRARLCNICGWRGGRFYDEEDMRDVKCPRCYSLPRHRLLKLALEESLPQLPGRTLHVSPKGESGLQKWLRRRSRSYVSIDKGGVWNTFENGGAMMEMDLTNLAFADNSMDLVACSHVLECIPDDRKAIREIFRVLAPGGLAALQVQLYGDVTVRVDNPDPSDYYHAWRPGRDYFKRYEEAGFTVQLYSQRGQVAERFRLFEHAVVPCCRKPR